MVPWWLALAATLESSSLAAWLRSSTWGYPAVEALHIFGIATLIGSAVAFDLRLLGAAASLPVDRLAGLLLPCARTGFGIAVASGLLLFTMQATTFAETPLFYVKLGVIALGISNASLFHRGIFRSVSSWNQTSATPAPAKAAAIVSLLAWTTALVCGRWLAYV